MAAKSPLNKYPYDVRADVETAIVAGMWIEDKGDELLEKVIRHNRSLIQIKAIVDERLAILEKCPDQSQLIQDEIVAWE